MKSYTRRKARKNKHRRAHRGGNWSQLFGAWGQAQRAAATAAATAATAAATAAAPTYESIRKEGETMAAAREAPVYNTDSIAIYSIDELSEHITVLRQEIARITQEWMSEGESARAALQEEEKRILRELEEKHVDMQTLLDDLHATLRTYETALAAKQPSPPARALWAPKQRGVTQRKGSPYYNPISVAAPSVPRTGVTMRLQNLVKQRR